MQNLKDEVNGMIEALKERHRTSEDSYYILEILEKMNDRISMLADCV